MGWELEKGIVYAERAEVHNPLFVVLARSWPDYDLLREDARFQAIVERLHFPANA